MTCSDSAPNADCGNASNATPCARTADMDLIEAAMSMPLCPQCHRPARECQQTAIACYTCRGIEPWDEIEQIRIEQANEQSDNVRDFA